MDHLPTEYLTYSTPLPTVKYSATYFRELTFRAASQLEYPSICAPKTVSSTYYSTYWILLQNNWILLLVSVHGEWVGIRSLTAIPAGRNYPISKAHWNTCHPLRFPCCFLPPPSLPQSRTDTLFGASKCFLTPTEGQNVLQRTKNTLTAARPVFTAGFSERNPRMFLNYDWVDVPQLRVFLQQNTPNSGLDTSVTRPSVIYDPAHVKIEPSAPSVPAGPAVLVKAEPPAIGLPPPSDIKIHTVNEDGREVIMLLSDSDSEPEGDDRDSDLEVVEALKHTSRSFSVITPSGT
ncbi:hypothetical protein DFH09DRAFT_1093171 [Mycena vulgaris]|nr:hypothetical protein DFH09DRAFT_1093171 [Mycena vulgaris]